MLFQQFALIKLKTAAVMALENKDANENIQISFMNMQLIISELEIQSEQINTKFYNTSC